MHCPHRQPLNLRRNLKRVIATTTTTLKWLDLIIVLQKPSATCWSRRNSALITHLCNSSSNTCCRAAGAALPVVTAPAAAIIASRIVQVVIYANRNTDKLWTFFSIFSVQFSVAFFHNFSDLYSNYVRAFSPFFQSRGPLVNFLLPCKNEIQFTIPGPAKTSISSQIEFAIVENDNLQSPNRMNLQRTMKSNQGSLIVTIFYSPPQY